MWSSGDWSATLQPTTGDPGLAFYPVSKTLWSAIDLAMRPLEPDEDVDPRFIPGSELHEP